MQELSTVKELVRFILTTDRRSRNCDGYLYLKVIEHQAKEKKIDLRFSSVKWFFLHSSEKGFANYESVRRARQKLQAECPELRGNERVQAARRENEAVFRDWAVE
jgi:hypothetical protein